MGVTLEKKLHEGKGCSMAKGIRMSIPSKTHSREVSKPLVVEEGDESAQDREASAANSESASEDGESVSEGTRSEIETPEAEAAALITSGRAPTPRVRGSQCGVSIDPEGMAPGESLADASATASTSHGPDKRYTALGAGEAK